MKSLAEAVEESGLPGAGPNLFVALDIDGTVLRHNNTLSPRVGEAIAAAYEARGWEPPHFLAALPSGPAGRTA